MSGNPTRLQDFGDIAAESNFRAEFFVSSDSWQRVRNGSRPIVIGRKGTGKTAIRFALLASEGPELFAADLSFRDYPWNAHNAVSDPRTGHRSRYVETWLFLMLVELAKLAVGRDQMDRFPSDAARARDDLRRFVVENWGGLGFGHHAVFLKQRFKVAKKKLEPHAVGFRAGSVEWETVDKERLANALREMNVWLREQLAVALRPDVEYFLVFDELDLDFDPDDPSYVDSVVGLLSATREFHEWSRQTQQRARSIVLLRDDIYRGLYFPDKTKLSDTLVETLLWTADDREEGNSLHEIIDARIRVLLDAPHHPDPWSLVFERPQESYAFMAERTYLRPRDLIKFCNLSLEVARKKNGTGFERIAHAHVEAAAPRYSAYLQEELHDEIFVHHREWESWLDLLRLAGEDVISRRKFIHDCRENPDFCCGHSAEEILSALYDFSVIGFIRKRPDTSTYELWRYKPPSVDFDQHTTWIRVHPGLCSTLDLRSGERVLRTKRESKKNTRSKPPEEGRDARRLAGSDLRRPEAETPSPPTAPESSESERPTVAIRAQSELGRRILTLATFGLSETRIAEAVNRSTDEVRTFLASQARSHAE